MSLIALVATGPKPAVVATPEDFTRGGGLDGTAVLIRDLEVGQLTGKSSNVSYDLRVGREYKDHRNAGKHDLGDDEEITVHPGTAVILETEEHIHLPRSRFACVVPKVDLLQDGLSNTMSKVDPGYDGHLLLTVFNLGKKTVPLRRRQACCSLCIFSVEGAVAVYDKPAKRIPGPRAAESSLQIWRDRVERNTGLVVVLTPVVAALCQIVVWLILNALN